MRAVPATVLAAVVLALVPSSAPAAHNCKGSIVMQVGDDPLQLDAPYPAGIAMPQCHGYANQSEGYVAVGTWSITYKRGFVTKTITNVNAPACQTELFEAGDEITAKVTQGYMFIFEDQGAARASCP